MISNITVNQLDIFKNTEFCFEISHSVEVENLFVRKEEKWKQKSKWNGRKRKGTMKGERRNHTRKRQGVQLCKNLP